MKDLTQDSLRPQLAILYSFAHKRFFGRKYFVREEQYPQFEVMEKRLRDAGIPAKEYTYTVISMLKKWAQDKGMRSVPINVFCGEWAMGKFLKVWESKTIEAEPVKDEDVILHTELMVARMYIHRSRRGFVRLRDIVKDLEDVLDKHWLEMYEAGERRPVTEALEILCEEFRIAHAKDYTDIVDNLVRNG